MEKSRITQPSQFLPSLGQADAVRTQEIAHRTGDAPAELRNCPHCSSSLVLPVDWSPHGETEWSVVLRCPECEWCDAVVASQEEVDELDRRLDDTLDAMSHDLARISRGNLEEEVERFAAAIHAGHVTPEDF